MAGLYHLQSMDSRHSHLPVEGRLHGVFHRGRHWKNNLCPKNYPVPSRLPNDISENLEIQFFDHWHIDTTPIQINTANFAFTENSAVNNHTIHFNYHYRSWPPMCFPLTSGIITNKGQGTTAPAARVHLPARNGTGLPGIYRPNWIGFIILGWSSGYPATSPNEFIPFAVPTILPRSHPVSYGTKVLVAG